jgi:hypothetical protein
MELLPVHLKKGKGKDIVAMCLIKRDKIKEFRGVE